MKIKIITTATIAIMTCGITHHTHAETCQQVTCSSTPSIQNNPACKNGKAYWICGYDHQGKLQGPFMGCDGYGCADGYDPTPIEEFQQCNNMIKNICKEKTVATCGTCESTAWTEIPSIPYATRTYKWCEGTTCKSQSQVGCKKGYYGTPTSVGSGCTQCPSSGGIYGTTTAIGATNITECNLPAGTAFSDSTGSGTYTGNCYYKN